MRLKSCLVLGLLAAWTVQPCLAQRPAKTPEPVPISLVTKDGVGLKVTYYASSAGKDSPVVVLLPDLKDSRGIYAGLAKRLQTPERGDRHKSMAAVAVDLRGHGDSVQRTLPNGKAAELSAARLRKADYIAMVVEDMEAVRRFLVEKNDLGELNLNRLAIVGAGLGASVAVNWSARDWSAPALAVGKQGQDVKSLVLISPRWNFNGLTMQAALRQPGVQEKIAMLIMYGNKDRKFTADALRIYTQLERYHPVPAAPKPDTLPTLKKADAPTELQGGQFLKQGAKPVEGLVLRFLSQHLSSSDYTWSDRP